MNPIIRFDHVSKRYRLRHGRPRSFRELFVRGGRRVGGQAPDRDTLWALRDACFEIQPAETVGLVGANGAGKSTVLKLISRVIMPNSGRIAVTGRVAALLELGAGFHPELSGRDNIYLSGALAGMSRQEINRKFDAIVAFSEMARFIDMPVKHYSSGMFARLAFAVSIHLDPDVLLVDEVLAVGDHSFQRKCLDRIAEMKQAGVTVCLVSHSAETVRTLCSRVLWFDHGQLMADDAAEVVVRAYLQYDTEQEAGRLAQEAARRGSPANGPATLASAGTVASPIRLVAVRFLNAAEQEERVFQTGDPLTLEMEYQADEPVEAPIFGMALHRHDGVHVTGPNTAFAGMALPTLCGSGVVRYHVAALPLLDGLYHVTVAVVNHDDSRIFDYHDRRYPFRVVKPTGATGERFGLVTLNGEWQHIPAITRVPQVQS